MKQQKLPDRKVKVKLTKPEKIHGTVETIVRKINKMTPEEKEKYYEKRSCKKIDVMVNSST